MRFFFILYFLIFIYPAFGQSTTATVNTTIIKADTVMLSPGLNNISEQGQTSFLVAMSYFPELSNSRIRLKYKKIRTTMNVRPTIGSLIFNGRENRKYIIRINSSTNDSVITLNELSSDAQIGVIGHELSHIVDYRMKNIWGVIARGFSYISKRRKANFEKEIDRIAIKHGLGCELYEWSNYVLHGSDASFKYKLFKSNTYLKPEEIRDLENAETPTQP